MLKKLDFFLVLLLFCSIGCDDTNDEDVFVATKEWQVVKKGQKIPKGLHVRLNLQTGLTEAKLLDESDPAKALSPLPDSPSDPPAPLPKPSLSEAMKNIKGDDILNPDDLKQIKNKFRSYAELKKSLDDLNLVPKLDAEVIADLVKQHQAILANSDGLDEEQLLAVIEDLDFLAHQYDNAREFVNQNGFNEIIYKNLNSSRVGVRKETLKLMGSVMQNNVAPKIHALETGAIGVLLRLVNFDSDSGVQLRALGALGALLRSFPVAQRKFVESGGLVVLRKLFDTDNIKIQTRAATMISDLVVEYNWASIDTKLHKYYTLDFTRHVLEHDWCDNLNRFLEKLVVMDRDDHDSIEKCLTAMQSLQNECGGKFDKALLGNLRQRYETLGWAESDGELSDSSFFHNLQKLCDDILRSVHKNRVKTEL